MILFILCFSNFSDSLSVYNSWKLVETLENVEDSQLCPVFDPFHERFDMRMKRNRILAENKHVLRAFAVVEWLQGMAFEEHVKNPKVALKNLEMEMTRTRQAAGQGNIVEYLDPDARSRTGKKISQSDLEDESEFYTAVFSLFRQVLTRFLFETIFRGAWTMRFCYAISLILDGDLLQSWVMFQCRCL